MANPKDVLVTTTSTLDNIKIKAYLKPVSAHIVAGTNIFSDFLGSITDVFGGKSQTYQKQLSSLYNEAINRIKLSANEVGGNCIIGLSIDLDEISGKGKSMFMITAIGTAVIIEKYERENNLLEDLSKKDETIDIDTIKLLQRKKKIIHDAESNSLILNEEVWNFITSNQIHGVYPFLIKQLKILLENSNFNASSLEKFERSFLKYIDSLTNNMNIKLLYESLKTEMNEEIVVKLIEIINELNLFDFEYTMQLLQNDNFEIRKRGISSAGANKQSYSEEDIKNLEILAKFINESFRERGTRTTKKQLLSKEKEIWVCECGKTNEIGSYCTSCRRDIYGFMMIEPNPFSVEKSIYERIEIIKESIN